MIHLFGSGFRVSGFGFRVGFAFEQYKLETSPKRGTRNPKQIK